MIWRIRKSRRFARAGAAPRAAFVLACALAAAGAGAAEPSLDTLLTNAVRFATTGEEAAAKAAARQALLDRGADGLAFLLSRIHVENDMIPLLAEELVRKLPDAGRVPVLADALDSDYPRTWRLAIYYLGLCQPTGLESRVSLFLEDREASRAAIRTLGKWKVREAVPRIAPFLADPEERYRVLAANALHDIGDASAVPALTAALGDPYFTVRRAAGRALAALGRSAERALLRELEGGEGLVQREAIRVLGEMRSRRAAPRLRGLVRHGAPLVREDAARALLAIEADRFEEWLARQGLESRQLTLPPF